MKKTTTELICDHCGVKILLGPGQRPPVVIPGVNYQYLCGDLKMYNVVQDVYMCWGCAEGLIKYLNAPTIPPKGYNTDGK
jgi:hypothetical protein